MKNFIHCSFVSTILLLVLSFSFCSCSQHFTSDSKYRKATNEAFKLKCEQLRPFKIENELNLTMSSIEREAMQFLYAYMPLCDIADCSGEFILENVRQSFKAKQLTDWGKNIPEDLFRHFVLPIRVNNENLDNFRIEYFDELTALVAGMDLYQAALEINHWCHSKVTYLPSDSRTSSPMSTIRTATGRCGEESTLLVAALRTVCIPSRQVYTPRWAHTDDNHAWVEVWVNGKWYFMGACEPEPVLNMAWFNSPASRALLMHTKVFGNYISDSDVINRSNCYTEINVISNYAKTRKSVVRVIDKDGNAVCGARVEYKIYNYSEFYTVTSQITDKNGEVSLNTGLGDMLAWASKDDKFSFAKISSQYTELVLNHSYGEEFNQTIEIVPPIEGNIPIEVTQEQIEANKLRLNEEDSIRQAYEMTFFDASYSQATPRINKILTASKGNWLNIQSFLENVPQSRFEDAISLLENISAKDLRDTPAKVLEGCLLATRHSDSELYVPYILCPRIASELLSDYKNVIKGGNLPEESAVKDNPQLMVQWCKDNLKIDDSYNPINQPITPCGVWKTRCADSNSALIFAVAALRTMSIPARIDQVTGKAQYYKDKWIEIELEKQSAQKPSDKQKGILTLSYSPLNYLPDPQYYRHFTIAQINEGSAHLLNFEEGDQTELGAPSWSLLFKNGFSLDDGYYLSTSGTRMASGKVIANMRFFNIRQNKNTAIALVMPRSVDELSVIGYIDVEQKFLTDSSVKASILSVTGRGYFAIAILGAKDEPSNHALRELTATAEAFNNWGRKLIILCKSKWQLSLLDFHQLNSVNNITYGYDDEGKILNMLTESCNGNSDQLPVIAIADSFSRVVFYSEGYNTSLSEQLKNAISMCK